MYIHIVMKFYSYRTIYLLNDQKTNEEMHKNYERVIQKRHEDCCQETIRFIKNIAHKEC